MTGTTEILAELQRRGVSVSADGDTVRLKPRRFLDDALLARIRDAKPAILEALRSRPVACATSCYEIEPGRWIHHLWDGCTTIKLEGSESRPKVAVKCWHCNGEKRCDCSACWQAGPSECVACTKTRKGDESLEPIYRLVGYDEIGAAVCRYYCPICEKEFIRRKACLSHITDCLERNWKEENHGFK